MKEPIEELFKQSLQGHEMPYNPEAWKAMNARLDVVSPVAQPVSYLKYYLGAAGIGAVAVATYFIFAGGTPEESKNPVAQDTQLEQTTTDTTKPSIGNGEAQTGNTSVISTPDENTISQEEGLQGSSDQKKTIDFSENAGDLGNKQNSAPSTVNKGDGKVDGPSQNKPNNSSKGGDGTTKNPNNEPSNVRSKMILPVIDDLCLNEEITITNPNDDEIAIYDALNKHVLTIPAKKSVIFKPTVIGNYHLQYADNYQWKTGSYFQVNRVPDADFMIDFVNKYKNGMPLTHVEAIGGQGTYTWTSEKQVTNGAEADLHFYNKGDKTITLTVDNGQCQASVEKTIYIEQDYNLMAVNAFTPTSTDPRNQTFMPFALTQRPNVNFELTIIDGRDGGTVYTTTDASLPWDGTDIRSGRRSETPQVYVWKVVITNPATNEPTEYRGTITMN